MTADHRDVDPTQMAAGAASRSAGNYLRARWKQWVMRVGSGKDATSKPTPLGLMFTAHAPDIEPETAARDAAAAKADTAASRNAQNCTFEVF